MRSGWPVFLLKLRVTIELSCANACAQMNCYAFLFSKLANIISEITPTSSTAAFGRPLE